eukprot:1178395-Prorocentrum_minimum.AAC.6
MITTAPRSERDVAERLISPNTPRYWYAYRRGGGRGAAAQGDGAHQRPYLQRRTGSQPETRQGPCVRHKANRCRPNGKRNPRTIYYAPFTVCFVSLTVPFYPLTVHIILFPPVPSAASALGHQQARTPYHPPSPIVHYEYVLGTGPRLRHTGPSSWDC